MKCVIHKLSVALICMRCSRISRTLLPIWFILLWAEIEQLVPASALDTALEGEGALSPLRAVLDASQMPQVARSTLEQFYGRHKKEKQQQPGGRFAQLSKLRTQDGEDADEVEMAALDDDDQWEDVGDDDDLDEDEDMEAGDEPASTIPKSVRVRGGRTIKVITKPSIITIILLFSTVPFHDTLVYCICFIRFH